MIYYEHSYLVCVIPEKNKNAYYRLIAGHDLFGHKLIRSWGRIGSNEKIRHQERFSSKDELSKAYRRILKVRFSHGYKVKGKSNASLQQF